MAIDSHHGKKCIPRGNEPLPESYTGRQKRKNPSWSSTQVIVPPNLLQECPNIDRPREWPKAEVSGAWHVQRTHLEPWNRCLFLSLTRYLYSDYHPQIKKTKKNQKKKKKKKQIRAFIIL